ncbi:hypothetical protein HK098_005979, partial [Nowakowskiella sp. JEL0407]
MGKAKRHAKRRAVETPSGPPVPTPPASSSGSQMDLPMLQKLTSTSPEDQAWAASSISLFAQDTSLLPLLQKQNVVGHLLATLSSPSYPVALNVAGALRNLATFGGSKIITEIINKNGLKIIFDWIPELGNVIDFLLKQSSTSSTLTNPEQQPQQSQITKPDETKTSLVYSLTEQIISLLWLISEHSTNNQLHQITTKSLPFLLSAISPYHDIPANIVIVSLQCLNCLAEDNPHFLGM